jgi:ABC-type phosphate/phosphonate transport system substrate-binding protein
MTAVASLMMYDQPDRVRSANEALWIAIRDRLRAKGFPAPDALDRNGDYHSYWLRPDLALAQTCGYPYVSELKGKVRLVATPVFSYPGGKGAKRASFIVVREANAAKSLEDLRGSRAAINDWGSNSGMNLLRIAMAPLAGGKPFFSDIIVTGGHLGSIAAIREGGADVAAIDSITWGLHARHAPEKIAGVRILTETPMGPGLPYITRADASDAEVAALREAISGALADPSVKGAIDVLGLTGIEILDDSDYAELERFRDEALRLGYPKVA